MADKKIGVVPNLQWESIADITTYNFSESDSVVAEEIKKIAKQNCDEMFDGCLKAIDNLYVSMYVPNVKSNGRVDRNDPWKKDENGKYIFDFDQLTGQSIDEAIITLSLRLVETSGLVSDLESDALLAKELWEDKQSESYSKWFSGTVSDKTAKSRRESRQEKYLAIFKYTIFNRAKNIQNNMKELKRTLESVRKFRQWDEK
jgi:hypothetical protein